MRIISAAIASKKRRGVAPGVSNILVIKQFEAVMAIKVITITAKKLGVQATNPKHARDSKKRIGITKKNRD